MKAKIELNGTMYDAELTPIESEAGRVEIGSGYWVILDNGNVVATQDIRSTQDQYFYDTGNYYSTEEEAEQALSNQRKVIEMRKWLKEQQGDWKPDFTMIEEKYRIVERFDINKFIICNDCEYKHAPNWKYIKSGEIANQMITKFGEDLHLWIEA
jgi:hypothetical protein